MCENKAILYGGIVGGAVLLILIVIAVVCLLRRRGRGGSKEQQNNKDSGVINILAQKFAFLKFIYFIGIVVVAPNNHYQPMPAVQKSNSEYERGDIALGEVKPSNEFERGDVALGAVKPPNNEYGHLAVRPATYDELQLIPPGTDYADASVLQ